MSTLTFSTSRPLAEKSVSAKWMSSRVESLLTVIVGCTLPDHSSTEGGTPSIVPPMLLGAVWKNTSPGTGLCTVKSGVPLATLWVSIYRSVKCVPAAPPFQLMYNKLPTESLPSCGW